MRFLKVRGTDTVLDRVQDNINTSLTELEALIPTVVSSTPSNLTVGPVGSIPNANGADVTSGVLTLEPASATQPGVLTTGVQSIGGSKDFVAKLAVGPTPAIEWLDVNGGGAIVRGSNAGLIGSAGLTLEYVPGGGGTGDGYIGAVDWTVTWQTMHMTGRTLKFDTSSSGSPAVLVNRAAFDDAGLLTLLFGLRLGSKGDTTGTPGSATANSCSGKSAIAAGASACTITNSFVKVDSQVFLTDISNDVTASRLYVSSIAAGSFTVTSGFSGGTANATATTSFQWVVL